MRRDVLYYTLNEVRSGVPALLKDAKSFPQLELDYGWLTPDGRVAVERKDAEDLARSLRIGRLKSQLERAKQSTPHVFLIVEEWHRISVAGNLNARLTWLRGNWTYGSLLTALYGMLYGLQVQFIPTKSVEDTAAQLQLLFQLTQWESLGSGSPPLPKWKHTRCGTIAESYARAIPNLGFKRAEIVAEAFPSWDKLLAAKPTQLRRLPGIGVLLSARIYNFLRGRT